MRIIRTSQLKRDYRLAKKQGRNLAELRAVVEKLAARIPLPPKHRDHGLSGQWNGYRDCHITPDWVLIYKISGDDLFLARMGSHSELFKK